jgi:hypothetical protein
MAKLLTLTWCGGFSSSLAASEQLSGRHQIDLLVSPPSPVFITLGRFSVNGEGGGKPEKVKQEREGRGKGKGKGGVGVGILTKQTEAKILLATVPAVTNPKFIKTVRRDRR